MATPLDAPLSDMEQQPEQTPQEQGNDQGSYGKSRSNNRGGRGRRGQSGNRPYARTAAPADTQPSGTDAMLKISPQSNPRSVAGAIAHISRQGECPGMLAIGSPSINQAVKAVAIARGYLEDSKLELTCYPEFRSDKRSGLKLTLIKSQRRGPNAAEPEPTPLKVSRESKPSFVAGAIAKKLREGERVTILAIGPDCVTHAVKSIFIARKYVEQDGLDISFRPEFTKVKFEDGRDCSAVKFVLLSQQI